MIVQAVTDLAPTIGVAAACRRLGVPRSAYYRRVSPRLGPAAPAAVASAEAPAAVRMAAESAGSANRDSAPPRRSARALSPDERAELRNLLNSARFADLAPREVYATLLDEGVYHCSISTIYRILREADEITRRREQLRRGAYAKPELLATRPRQLWSWDITKLKGPTTGTYFYLDVILDVYSRYVVGWLIADHESAELAEVLIAETCAQEGIAPGQLTIHADRGSAMTSKTVAQLLADLGVAKTHSRVHVSDDNPFSEAQVGTVNYHPSFPDRFGSSADARVWARAFFQCYNYDHHHTGLGLLTPAMVHHDQVVPVLAARQAVLATAYQMHPERFVRGQPCPSAPPAAVWINPPADRLPAAPPLFPPTPERTGPVQPAPASVSRGDTA